MNIKQKMREVYGEDIIEIIDDTLKRLNIPSGTDKPTPDGLVKLSLLLQLETIILQAQTVIKADDTIAILRELLNLNERILARATTAANERINQARKSEYN